MKQKLKIIYTWYQRLLSYRIMLYFWYSFQVIHQMPQVCQTCNIFCMSCCKIDSNSSDCYRIDLRECFLPSTQDDVYPGLKLLRFCIQLYITNSTNLNQQLNYTCIPWKNMSHDWHKIKLRCYLPSFKPSNSQETWTHEHMALLCTLYMLLLLN